MTNRARVNGRVGRAALLGLALAASACGRSRSARHDLPDAGPASIAGLSAEQASQVLARVGDRAITLGDYAATLDRMDQFDRLRYESAERRKELLNELVDFELLAGDARRKHLDETPEVRQAIRQILRDAVLAEVRRGLGSPADVPASEVRAYYDAHRDDFREPERRRASHILVRDPATAQRVVALARRASAAEWGDLVGKYSVATVKRGEPKLPVELSGDLGIVGPPGDARGDNPRVPAAVRRAVFEIAAIGGVSDKPFQDDDGFHIVRMTGKTDARERSLEDSERTIRVAILQARLAERERALEADLRQKFSVTIDEVGLAAGGGIPGSVAP